MGHRAIKVIGLCIAILIACGGAAPPKRPPRAPNHIGQMKNHPAPPFTLKTIDEKTVTLAEFKGRVVLIVIGKDGIIKEVFIGYGPKTAPKIDEAVEAALTHPGAATHPSR